MINVMVVCHGNICRSPMAEIVLRRMLEEEGLVLSHSGAKSLMVVDDVRLAAIRGELVEEDARNAVKGLKQMGLTREEVFALIEKYWDGGDDHETT